MAIPKLFKPFHHEPSKQVYFDGAPSHNNPILIAHNEYKITWTGYGFAPDYPDIVLSIGTGLETESSRNSQDTTECDNAWDDYINLLPISDPGSRFVRLNPAFSEALPAPDDTGRMKSLQNLVRSCINGDQIKRLAAQLFATLFYFESSDTILETSDNQFLVQGKLLRPCSSKLVQLILFPNLGHILCRLPNETPEIC